MQYTEYYVKMVSERGTPQLNSHSSSTIAKIIYLEGRAHGLSSVSKKMHSTDTPHKFEIDVFNMGRKLTELTGNRDPKEVFEQLIKLGQ